LSYRFRTPGGVRPEAWKVICSSTGRTFVCYQGAFGTSDRVAVVAVDDRGRALGEPIAISDDVYLVSCSLAWSGDALLATWNDLRMRSNISSYSLVGARILSLR
jgi:hypothetical protein